MTISLCLIFTRVKAFSPENTLNYTPELPRNFSELTFMLIISIYSSIILMVLMKQLMVYLLDYKKLVNFPFDIPSGIIFVRGFIYGVTLVIAEIFFISKITLLLCCYFFTLDTIQTGLIIVRYLKGISGIFWVSFFFPSWVYIPIVNFWYKTQKLIMLKNLYVLLEHIKQFLPSDDTMKSYEWLKDNLDHNLHVTLIAILDAKRILFIKEINKMNQHSLLQAIEEIDDDQDYFDLLKDYNYIGQLTRKKQWI